MGQPKALASLTAGLLARKGDAKPAMRPQFYAAQDDLGWNDMGEPPASKPPRAVPIPIAFGQPALDAPPPPVVAQQAALAASFASETARARAAAGAHGKSAFTLRLDEARHLRLRLMGAHRHRSAQSLVTEALDRLLDDFERGKV
jgi:hypothetical protein